MSPPFTLMHVFAAGGCSAVVSKRCSLRDIFSSMPTHRCRLQQELMSLMVNLDILRASFLPHFHLFLWQLLISTL
jgi:hypothetical protein